MAMPTGIKNLGGEPFCCEVPCDHDDCRAIRNYIGKACVRCHEGMARGDEYTYVGVRDGLLRIAHTGCEQEHYIMQLGRAAAGIR